LVLADTLTEALHALDTYVLVMKPSTREKATLFCAVCGHESPPDGDWVESEKNTELGDRLALSCPDCETTVTRRPLDSTSVDAVVAAD
jgi:hypothetical protein